MIAITGGVLSTLLFIILSIILIITLILTYNRCRKKQNTSSLNIVSHAEVSNAQTSLHIENIVMETNLVYVVSYVCTHGPLPPPPY